MTNRSSLSGLLTSICHCSFVICHLLRMWGRRGGRAGQQPRERLGIPDAVEGGVYLLDLLPKNLTVRFGIEFDGLCEVCYGLVAHVPLGVQDPETEVVAGLALAQGDHLLYASIAASSRPSFSLTMARFDQAEAYSGSSRTAALSSAAASSSCCRS